MGFFSKVWKGIKGTFKNIGKGIKKTYKKFGKFMNKIGILGQVAMMFILPAIGNALMANVMNLASWGVEAGGVIGKIAEGAAWTLGKAQQFAQFAKGTFSDLTKPITGFFKTTGKYVGSKLQAMKIPLPKGWNIPENYTFKQAKADWWQESVTDNWNVFKDEGRNLFSRSIESVLPETGPVTLGPGEQLKADPLEGLTERQKARYGDKLVDQDTLRVETTFPSGRVESTYASEAGSIAGKEAMEGMFEKAVTDPKTGIRTYAPPDPTAVPEWAQKGLGKKAYEFPQQVYETTASQLTSDVGKSLLSGEKVGTLTYFDDPRAYTPRSRVRGTFEADPAPLAGDQNLAAFMSFEDDYGPPNPFDIWGGQSNYRNYLNRFAPTQQKYA